MPSLKKKKTLAYLAAAFVIFSLDYGFLIAPSLAQDALAPKPRLESKNLDSSGLAEGRNGTQEQEEGLSQLQKDARLYRQQGYILQNAGNLDEALKLYQKAIEMDPAYVVLYNDLGVLFEAKGFPDKAEDFYQKAIKMDPYFLSAYSNLAYLYENKGDFHQASYYWSRRIDLAREMGLEADPWTAKAKLRLEDISALEGGNNEYEVISFMKDVARKKALMRRDNRELAKSFMEKAKINYVKEDYITALKQALDARQLDPANPEIEEFVEKIQLRVLSR